MLDMRVVINRMLAILILLCIGYLARKLKYTDAVSNQKLSHIIVNIAQCGLILGSVMNVEPSYSKAQALSALGISFIMMAVFTGLGYLTPILLRDKGETRGTYVFMTAFSNVGIMGMPLVASIFGPETCFLATLFSIPFNLFMYTVGLAMISGTRQNVRFSPRWFFSPPLLASLAAFFIFFLDIPFPTPVADAAYTLGEFVLPGSMLVLGSSLAGIPTREVFSGVRFYVHLLLKLIAYPLLVGVLLRLFIQDPIILGVLTVIAAMPIASSATMLSIEYGGNEKLATRGVVLSTFLSVVTVPLIVYLLLV
jgi:predicted permease